MQGSVLHYDDSVGTGQISGDDGVRYNFSRSDMKQLVPLRAGMRVDFDPDEKFAREIYVIASSGVPGVRAAVPFYSGPAESDLGLFGYFKRCFTEKYSNFYGRARRKEYWGFTLFTSLISILGALVIGIGAAMSSEATSRGEGPNFLVIIGVIALVLFIIACILPSVAVTVRRFHDIGQSGWVVLLMYVLSAIPYLNFISGVVWLVMVCLDTQPQENKYGPPPKQVG